jgi:hypothetical protein
MVRIQTPGVTGFKESLQPAVSESEDHSPTVTCNGSRVNTRPLVGEAMPRSPPFKDLN